LDKPILRKDFILDDYQVYEARAYGADAVLLMAALHVDAPARMQRLYDLTTELGMEALVEVGMSRHDVGQLVAAVPAGAQIWGINSRKFTGIRATARVLLGSMGGGVARRMGLPEDLLTDRSRHVELRNLVPSGRIAVAESGIHTGEHLRSVLDAGYQAALIGTAFLDGKRSVEAVAQDFSAVVAHRSHRAASAESPSGSERAVAAYAPLRVPPPPLS
jgi:indole-3-glycerol phosphate synthase